MIREYGIIRQAAARIAKAANGTVEALKDGRIEQEPAFTDRMLGGIEQAMSEFRTKGIRWTAKTLTDRGPGAQEKSYGADFVGLLDIDLPGFAVKKGFLAPAKLLDGERGWHWEWHRMTEQCDRMLRFTPDSFVFLYSRNGIKVVPASAVVAVDFHSPHFQRALGDGFYGMYSRQLSRFYEEHLECFIGDPRIRAANTEALEALRREYQSRSLLYLAATTA